jgi:hypothetical protein
MLAYQFRQILVGRNNYSCVGGFGLGRTQGFVGSVLKHPQQSHLKRRAHFSDFIQKISHMLERNTSEQNRPMASLREVFVIFSAARLNEVMRHSRSTVKTPSEMLSRMASVGVSGAGVFVFLRTFILFYEDSPCRENQFY